MLTIHGQKVDPKMLKNTKMYIQYNNRDDYDQSDIVTQIIDNISFEDS